MNHRVLGSQTPERLVIRWTLPPMCIANRTLGTTRSTCKVMNGSLETLKISLRREWSPVGVIPSFFCSFCYFPLFFLVQPLLSHLLETRDPLYDTWRECSYALVSRRCVGLAPSTFILPHVFLMLCHRLAFASYLSGGVSFRLTSTDTIRRSDDRETRV